MDWKNLVILFIGNELVSYEPSNDYSSLLDIYPDPMLGDDTLGLLSDEPVGLSSSSTLNTPDIGQTPSLTVSSPLATKRKKKTPTRVVKTESKD